jgi:hypothetical protein
MMLQMWQIAATAIVAFLFGFGTGRTFGESRAWKKMEQEEEQEERKREHTSTLL